MKPYKKRNNLFIINADAECSVISHIVQIEKEKKKLNIVSFDDLKYTQMHVNSRFLIALTVELSVSRWYRYWNEYI